MSCSLQFTWAGPGPSGVADPGKLSACQKLEEAERLQELSQATPSKANSDAREGRLWRLLVPSL